MLVKSLLDPKTEVERAFVQAISWNQMHSWKRGTIELRAGRVGSAIGIYLALVRSQALTGQLSESYQTLDCLDGYGCSLSGTEKVSSVNILCHLLMELRSEEAPGESRKKIIERLAQSTQNVIAQIKEDKMSVAAATARLKKALEETAFEEENAARDEQALGDVVQLRELIEEWQATYDENSCDEKEDEKFQPIYTLAQALIESATPWAFVHRYARILTTSERTRQRRVCSFLSY